MPEDKDALLQHYRRMREDLLSTIDGLDDAQMTERTLDGWSVKDHLAHLAFWDDVRAAEVERIAAGYGPAWNALNEEQTEAFNALMHQHRAGLSLEQVRWELAASRQRLIEAIVIATPRALDPALYGEAALRRTHEAQHTGWIRRWRAERG